MKICRKMHLAPQLTFLWMRGDSIYPPHLCNANHLMSIFCIIMNYCSIRFSATWGYSILLLWILLCMGIIVYQNKTIMSQPWIQFLIFRFEFSNFHPSGKEGRKCSECAKSYRHCECKVLKHFLFILFLHKSSKSRVKWVLNSEIVLGSIF